MKYSDNSFFDYLDGVMPINKKREFEQYLKENNNAKLKLNSLKENELYLKNLIYKKEINSEMSGELEFQINNIGKKIDETIIKDNKFRRIFLNFFKPLLDIPIQSKGVIGVFGIFMFFLGSDYIFTEQENKNKGASDIILEISKINQKNFIETSKNGDKKFLKLNNNNYTLEDVTNAFKKQKLNNSYIIEENCNKNEDSKIVEVSEKNKLIEKKIYTYCGDKVNNNWSLLKIEIPKNDKLIEIQGNYRITFDNEKITLFPIN